MINYKILFFIIGVLYDGTSRLSYTNGKTIYQYLLAGMSEYNIMPEWSVYEITEKLHYDNSAIIGCAI